MISIITAIYNQLEINKLFVKYLKQYTRHPFELIVVDNQSTDGSGDFFRSAGAKLIQNDGNYSYPRCQNQGIRLAKHDVLAFLNNDVIVSPDWDGHLLEVMDHHRLEVACCCGVERVENKKMTRFYRKKWSVVRNTIGLLGHGSRTLQWMHRAMYGNWERFAQKRWETFGYSTREGFVGSSVIMRRSALDKIGLWDERIGAADFDLYLRSRQRNLEKGDLQPVQVALGVFNHHYIRMTSRGGYPKFEDGANLISLEDKWGKEQIAKFLKDLE